MRKKNLTNAAGGNFQTLTFHFISDRTLKIALNSALAVLANEISSTVINETSAS